MYSVWGKLILFLNCYFLLKIFDSAIKQYHVGLLMTYMTINIL